MWPRRFDTGQVLEPKVQRLGGARSPCSEPCCSHFPFASWQTARLTPATQRPVEPPPIIALGCALGVLSICPLSECGASAPWRPSYPTTALCRRATPTPALRVYPWLYRCPSPPPHSAWYLPDRALSASSLAPRGYSIGRRFPPGKGTTL